MVLSPLPHTECPRAGRTAEEASCPRVDVEPVVSLQAHPPSRALLDETAPASPCQAREKKARPLPRRPPFCRKVWVRVCGTDLLASCILGSWSLPWSQAVVGSQPFLNRLPEAHHPSLAKPAWPHERPSTHPVLLSSMRSSLHTFPVSPEALLSSDCVVFIRQPLDYWAAGQKHREHGAHTCAHTHSCLHPPRSQAAPRSRLGAWRGGFQRPPARRPENPDWTQAVALTSIVARGPGHSSWAFSPVFLLSSDALKRTLWIS